jgi:hypothetical protein
MSIGVHVIGPGHGESIIIELPDQTVGVIDACRPGKTGRGHFPARDFLRDRQDQLRVNPLRFLAVTHPHADHCLGVDELRREFEPERIWVFHSIFTTPLTFLKAWADGRLTDPTAEDLGVHSALISLEFLELRKYARKLMDKRDSPDRFKTLEAGYETGLCGGTVSVRFFSPPQCSRHRYNDRITQATERLLDQLIEQNVGRGVDSSALHNLVSPLILIAYGTTRIVLMADTETPLWGDILGEQGECDLALLKGASFIKAAHHGSENGYNDSVYKTCCDGGTDSGKTTIVVTPFTRLRNPLPREGGINQLLGHKSPVYCTNRFVATYSANRRCTIDPEVSARLDAGPLLPEITKDPTLINFLAPEFGGPDSLPSHDATLPQEWRRLCLEDRELLRLLHPELREVTAILLKSPNHDAFRTSFYFDDQGNEDVSRRYVGVGAGLFTA